MTRRIKPQTVTWLEINVSSVDAVLKCPDYVLFLHQSSRVVDFISFSGNENNLCQKYLLYGATERKVHIVNSIELGQQTKGSHISPNIKSSYEHVHYVI